MVQLSKGHKWAVALYFVLLFCFLVIRAYSVPLLPDEAFTYFLYVEPITFFAPTAQVDANNHLLNSVLSFISTGLFGHSTFALRIPSLLFALLYFYATFRLAKNLPDKLSFWLTIIALNSIYPVLEFHSLSRGYGMSFALLMLGAFLVFDFQRNKSIKTTWWLLLIVILGLFAQLSLLFALTGMFILTTYILLKETTIAMPLKLSFSALIVILLLAFSWHIHALKSAGLLYFGTTDGFPLSSVLSLVELLYDVKSIPILVVLTILFSLTLLYLCWKFFKNIQNLHIDQSIIFPFILASSIGGTIVSVTLLNAHGPLARTALYFFILLIASLMFMYTSKNKGIFLKLCAFVLATFTLSLANVHNVNTGQIMRLNRLYIKRY